MGDTCGGAQASEEGATALSRGRPPYKRQWGPAWWRWGARLPGIAGAPGLSGHHLLLALGSNLERSWGVVRGKALHVHAESPAPDTSFLTFTSLTHSGG